MLILLFGCSPGSAKISGIETVIDNNILYKYDSNTRLTINDFNNIRTLNDLKNKIGNQVIHTYNDASYSVYSL
jgi:hypothetical protein